MVASPEGQPAVIDKGLQQVGQHQVGTDTPRHRDGAGSLRGQPERPPGFGRRDHLVGDVVGIPGVIRGGIIVQEHAGVPGSESG